MDNEPDETEALNNPAHPQNNKKNREKKAPNPQRPSTFEVEHIFKTTDEFTKWRNDGGFKGWYVDKIKDFRQNRGKVELYSCLTQNCSQKMRVVFRPPNKTICITLGRFGHNQEAHDAEALSKLEIKENMGDLDKNVELDIAYLQFLKEFETDQLPSFTQIRNFTKQMQKDGSPLELLSGNALLNYINSSFDTPKDKNWDSDFDKIEPKPEDKEEHGNKRMNSKSNGTVVLEDSAYPKNNIEGNEETQKIIQEPQNIEDFRVEHIFKTTNEFVEWRDNGGCEGWYFNWGKKHKNGKSTIEYYGCLTYGCSQKMRIVFNNSRIQRCFGTDLFAPKKRIPATICVLIERIGHNQEAHNTETLLTLEIKQRIIDLTKNMNPDLIHPQLMKEFENDKVPSFSQVRHFAKKSLKRDAPSKLLTRGDSINCDNVDPNTNETEIQPTGENNRVPNDVPLQVVAKCIPDSSKPDFPGMRKNFREYKNKDGCSRCHSTQDFVSKKFIWFSVPLHKNLFRYFSLNSHDYIQITFKCTNCKIEKQYMLDKGRKGIKFRPGYYMSKSELWDSTKKQYSFAEIEQMINELDNDYKLLTKNCKHFCRDFYRLVSGRNVTVFGRYFNKYVTAFSHLCQDVKLLVQFYRRHFHRLYRVFFTNKAIPYKTFKHMEKFQKLSEYGRFKEEYKMLDNFWQQWEPLPFSSNLSTKVRLKGPRGSLRNKFNYISHRIFNLSMIIWHLHLMLRVRRPLLAAYKMLPKWLHDSIWNFHSFGSNFPDLGSFNFLYKTANLFCGIASLPVLLPTYLLFPSLLTMQGQFILRFRFDSHYIKEQLNDPIILNKLSEQNHAYKRAKKQCTKYLFEVCKEPLKWHEPTF